MAAARRRERVGRRPRRRAARLLLRPFEAGDVVAYARIRAKPEVMRFMPGG
jgi:ribosomal-protein-alanine N-acetyltransferase